MEPEIFSIKDKEKEKNPLIITEHIEKLADNSSAKRDELDRMGAGQRAINLIWETTQMKIAVSVIWTSLMVSAVLAIMGGYLGTPDIQLAAVVFLFGVANLVTGFYFGRTNHQKTGGVRSEEVGR